MQQYFLPDKVANIGDVFSLEKSDHHHLFTVLRAQAGEVVQVVFSDQSLMLAEVGDDQATLTVTESLTRQIELPIDVTIAVGLPKGDKLEFIAQKTTELGAYELIGFPAKWSVTKLDAKKASKKTERLHKIVKGAAEQSKRLRIPGVQLLDSLKALTDLFGNYDVVLVAYEESAKSDELSMFTKQLAALNSGGSVLVIFGSEGGISPEEIAVFTQLGAVQIGLGPRIMRAETAPLYVLSAMSFYTELLK